MKLSTHRALTAAAAVALGLAGQPSATARAHAGAGPPAVGHTVRHMIVPGSAAGESREVDVHLWYPAEREGLFDAPPSVYRSALWQAALPEPLAPLSWEVRADVAREDAPIDPDGRAFPAIVFSHGSVNDPIDYAHTLELIAGAGFVVAAPAHVNNTQDDVRIDYVNQLAGSQLYPCRDHRPSPCSRPSVQFSMKDRVSDISHVLDALPGWLGDRVDSSRAGVLGHSRGTVTALAAAGGSTAWGIGRPEERHETRVKAIMGMAIGVASVVNLVDLDAVTVPTVLVAGGRDQNSVQAISEAAFAAISSADKLFVAIPNATHRSFDSTHCAQLQSAGAYAKGDPNAVLDQHTVALVAASPGVLSGKAVHYCAPGFFTSPVNIQRVVASTPNAEYFCSGTEAPGMDGRLDPSCTVSPPLDGRPTLCVTTSIPCTGLDTEEVKQGVKEIAVAFFDSALKRRRGEGIRFARYLAPRWLMKHVPMVGSAQAYAGPGSVCPPGQGVICAG